MRLRVADLELLFTVNTDPVAKAEKTVKATADRIEKKPITVDADTKPALDGMDRVEKAAKNLVSKETALRLDTDISRSEKSLDRTKQRLEDLRARALGGLDVTADVKRAEASLSRIERHLDGLKSARSAIEIEADPDDALKSMDRVEDAAKRLVSKSTAIRINANIEGAEAAVKSLRDELDYLRSLDGTVNVDADVRSAEAKLAGAEAALRDLQGARAQMVVDVNDGGAKQKLEDVEGYAGQSGEDAGEAFGENIIAALVSIPIAGAVIALGKAAADALIDAFNDGLEQERSFDRLQALTGLTEKDALRFGRAAGEAYANVFGESIEANMDTARLALQFDLIDPEASTRSAQKVVEGLGGIADVLDADVRPVATAVTTLLRSGLAKSADEAFDILATGAREGLNRNEDLLDTLTEYPVVLSKLGLSGQEMLGLLNQSLEAGARNSDIAADALKEFQIRATDSSELSAQGFETLGLSAEEMTAKIAAGGAGAREGLQQVLQALRETEDPVARNAAAVALFGTKAEDLGDALFAMDLSSAVDQLNGVEGAARKMFDTLADNDATKLDQAQRNIEVASDGIKGALASAFAEPLGDFADWVSENRGPVLQFFQDMVDGAIEFGHTMIDVSADSTEAFGEFVSGPLAEVIDGMAGVIDVFNGNEGRPKELDDLAEGMRGFKDETSDAADRIRGLHGELDDASDRFNGFMDGAVAMGYLNDASLRLANAVDAVGVSADGTKLSLDGIDLSNLRASESGRVLEDQVRAAVGALSEEVDAAARAGEGQEALTERYNAARDALVGQLEQMGLTEGQARSLIDTVLKTPTSATTEFSSNAQAEQAKVQRLNDRVVTLDDGSIVIVANTAPADAAMESFFRTWNGTTVAVNVANPRNYARGAVVEFMAGGGLRGLTPMQSIAQMVPPNTWRVVGDRGDVPELFAPLDGSVRSWQLLFEGLRRMPGQPPEFMAAGAVTAGGTARSSWDGSAPLIGQVVAAPGEDPVHFARGMTRVFADEIGGLAP